MIRVLIRLSLVLLVCNHLFTTCEALRSSRGYGNSKYSKNENSSGPKSMAGTSPGIPSQHSTRRGLGLSAWGIVALIVFLILAGMGVYYFVTCYPIICQKQAKYNMMDMTTV